MTVMQSSPSEIFSNEIISPVSPLRGVLNSLLTPLFVSSSPDLNTVLGKALVGQGTFLDLLHSLGCEHTYHQLLPAVTYVGL